MELKYLIVVVQVFYGLLNNMKTNICFFKGSKMSLVKQKVTHDGLMFYSIEFKRYFYTKLELFNFMNLNGYFHLTQNTLKYIYE